MHAERWCAPNSRSSTPGTSLQGASCAWRDGAPQWWLQDQAANPGFASLGRNARSLHEQLDDRRVAGPMIAARKAPPGPQQLASLGTVLCLYRPQRGSPLSGWRQAVRAESRAGVCSDGLRESLVFFDAEGACCWCLYLLPDSDFLAWDRMIELLPGGSDTGSIPGIGERLWRRLAGRLRGGQWQACVMKLHVLQDQAGTPSWPPAWQHSLPRHRYGSAHCAE